MNRFLSHVLAAVLLASATFTASSAEEKEGDDWPLIFNWDLTEITEDFSSAVSDQPLKLERWKNIANVGTRAWWGYDLEENGVVNKVAKVTAYDPEIGAGKETPCEMLLITPPLDAHNALTNFLTFRIKGENLSDDMVDKLEIVYVSDSIFGVAIEPLTGIDIPCTAAENGKWHDYVIDLSYMELDADFCIGFRFKSKRGSESSVIYYLDDVTYGHNDIPYIKPNMTEDAFITYTDQTYTRTFTAKGYALSDVIKVELAGDDADKFSVSANELSMAGGRFTLTFASDEVRVHNAEIQLSSKGANPCVIKLSGDNRQSYTSVEAVEAEAIVSVLVDGGTLKVVAPSEIKNVNICNAAGQLLREVTPNSSTAAVELPAINGVVFVTVATVNEVKTFGIKL